MCTWGSCPAPCQVQGSVQAVYPVKLLFSPRYKVTAGGTTRVAAASSPSLESAPTVTTTAPSPQGPGWSGGRGHRSAQLGAAWQQERPCCPVSSRPLPVPGGVPDPGLCPRCPGLWVCTAGITFPGPHSGHHLSCSRGPTGRGVQPFRELSQ